MSDVGPQKPYKEPKFEEPYESLVRWQSGAEPGSPAAEEAKHRLFVLLTTDIVKALTTFNTTTSRLNRILIGLTLVLVIAGLLQLWITLR